MQAKYTLASREYNLRILVKNEIKKNFIDHQTTRTAKSADTSLNLNSVITYNHKDMLTERTYVISY